MRCLIVTGMSGAGKTTVLKLLEDRGFFCVDNLPVELLSTFEKLMLDRGDEGQAAIGIDIRSGSGLETLEAYLKQSKDEQRMDMDILFLDASDEVLVKRFKETRRKHPLATGALMADGIAKEREALQFLRNAATHIIDTSQLLTRELKQAIDSIIIDRVEFDNIMISVVSFGFKFGIPLTADLVFDVRFLPNPFYIEELRLKTGNDAEVHDYVMSSRLAGEFLDQLEKMIVFLVPNYVTEGKNQLVIAIGCTGGKHRSITIARELARRLQRDRGYRVRLSHRDEAKNDNH
ncbi:MAG: RNase adapter RapZ [Lachnospiraceae bacterium]|nr:RNase adapter RapZ [Lachnospiraceae bacterium]MDY5741756.1 RNase adapter RapZ [Lachnospiraceae bacterium]